MPTALDFQLAHQFDELCRRLSDWAAEPSPDSRAGDSRAELWDLPLAYWAVPKDRRLPKALLGYSLRRVVETPFTKLRATPGIGVKKLATLLELLERALASRDGGPPAAAVSQVGPSPAVAGVADGDGELDPGAVSESQWAQWCEAVNRHGLADEPLGRFALALSDLPGVLWQTPLSDYTGLTLEALRGRKTHGEKRVRAIIEVFAAVQSLLGDQHLTHLSVRIVPGFAAPLESWLLQASAQDAFPSAEDVQRAFVDPLVEQLRHDAGETVARLASDRLLAAAGAFNVRSAARQLGLTRARVYQLLTEASTVMSVRWPEGSNLVNGLREKVRRANLTGDGARLFVSAADLFYPRRGSPAGTADAGPRAATRPQRGGGESDSEDQPLCASPRPPGHARAPRPQADRRGPAPAPAAKPARSYGVVAPAPSIDTPTCCPT